MRNRERPVEGRRPRKKHRLIRLLICLMLLVAVMAGYARYIEPYLLTQESVQYVSEDLAELLNGIRIAIFADTHFSEYYTPEDFQKVVDRINAEKPDLIFFLGDLIDDYSTYPGDVGEIEKGLCSLEAGIGKYAVYGNHDYGGKMEFDYPEVMKAGGFHLLINESVYLEDLNLEVMGIDDMVIGYGDPDAAAVLKEERYNVVLCHEPDIADRLKSYAVDLMLSGHTHGRQINLVNIHQRIGTDNPVTCPEIFVRSLEVGHRERSVPELECHETVAVLADFLLAELPVPDMLLCQNIIRL